MSYSIAIFVAVVFTCAATLFKKYHDGNNLNSNLLKLAWRDKRLLFSTLAIFIIISVGGAYLFEQSEQSYLSFLRDLVLILTLYLIAIIDYQKKLIPNKLIVFLLLSRLIILVIEYIQYQDLWRLVVYPPLIGLLIGGGIILVALFISRSGIGEGDVKLYAAIGFFVGSSEILSVFFFSFLFSAIGSITLMILRKAKLKDSVPMAPFAFLGVLIVYILQ